MKAISYFGLVVLLIMAYTPISLAATISGTVYDLTLNRIDNVKVEIDTQPLQRDITENGEYSFDVDSGNYTITAEYYQNNQLESSTIENITVTHEGSFRLDLVLFPDFTSEEELAGEELDFEVSAIEELDEGISIVRVIIVIIVIAILGFLLYLFARKKPAKHEATDELPEQIINFIKSQEGRVTQKDIRKHFPSSEAKISLVITELVEKGRLEKIKKGRGNIIRLK